MTHISFPMEIKRGNIIIHPDFNLVTHNGVVLVPGKIGNAASVEGNGEYITLGDQSDICMGNLSLCNHGITISFYIFPRRLLQNGYLLSSGPYSVYSIDGRVSKMHCNICYNVLQKSSVIMLVFTRT